MQKRYLISLLFILLSLNLIFSPVSLAQTKGHIEWCRGYIETTGQAVPPDNVKTDAQKKLLAREGAILMARKRMLEIVEGVHIEGKTTMVNMMANVKVNQKVEGTVQDAYIVEGSEKWDGEIYQIKMRKPLDQFYKIVYEENRSDFTEDPPAKSSNYTGLVIDARGVELTPQIMFEIIDRKGNSIYSAAKAFYSPAVDQGLTGYSSSLQKAKEDPRTGENPLVVEAIGADGDLNTTVIVSKEDGTKIKSELDETKIFRKTRVIVVID